MRRTPWSKGSKLAQWVLAVTFGIICSGPLAADSGLAASARELDTSVNVALERFTKQVKGAKEFISAAKGLLVLPNVKKGGFIAGAEYGEGALRIKGKTAAYYNLFSASFGLQIGVQAKDIVIAFMTEESLQQFRHSQGWEVGVDGNIALMELGSGERLDTTTLRDPVVGFVYDVKGLMADVSLKGAKITEIHPAR
jgi:lipid-binding SYLF domain-containing protein